MTLREEFATRNFSIYGQWTGVLCIVLCFALGLANLIDIFRLTFIFGAICLVFSFIILFVEVPLLLRICPTSTKFDELIRKVSTNYIRAGVYAVMSTVMWLSLITGASSLIAAAIVLLAAGSFYALAGLKGQDFVGSKTLGGAGVAQMII